MKVAWVIGSARSRTAMATKRPPPWPTWIGFLLIHYVPIRIEVVLRVIAGVVQIFEILGVVATTGRAHPAYRAHHAHRRRRHRGRLVHRVVITMTMRG